jgi:hypothetical protein
VKLFTDFIYKLYNALDVKRISLVMLPITSKVTLDIKENQNIDTSSTGETGTNICIRDLDTVKRLTKGY